MFNNKSVNISIPNGPYPKCAKDDCDGAMFPIIEPASTHYYQDPGESWVEGTAILYWKCGKCNIIIR